MHTGSSPEETTTFKRGSNKKREKETNKTPRCTSHAAYVDGRDGWATKPCTLRTNGQFWNAKGVTSSANPISGNAAMAFLGTSAPSIEIKATKARITNPKGSAM